MTEKGAAADRMKLSQALGDHNVQGFVMPTGEFLGRSAFEKRVASLREQLKVGVDLPQSEQISEEDAQLSSAIMEATYTPVYDPNALRHTLKLSTVHYRCVKAKAADTVEAWHVEALAGLEEDEEVRDQIKTATKFLATAFGAPNGSVLKPPLEEVSEQAMVDYESVGYGAFEIGRGLDGKVARIWHLPSYSLRRIKKNKGVFQIRGQKKRYFQYFPEKCPELPKGNGKGKPNWVLRDPITGVKKGSNPHRAANEIIIFSNYHPLSEQYGLPDFISSTPSMLGNLLASDFNLNRFTNWMVPAYAVLITGGVADDPTRQLIEQYFADLKGSGRDTLILAIPGKDATITFKKLEADIEEASFADYMRNNRDEVRLAHGVHPARVGIIETAQLGAGSADAQIKHYKNSIIKPRQRKLAQVFWTIFLHGLGLDKVRLVFDPPDLLDRKLQQEILCAYVDRVIKTRNEARKELGLCTLQELPEDMRDPDWAVPQPRELSLSLQERMKTTAEAALPQPVEHAKALARRDKLDEERAKLTEGYRSLWQRVKLEPGMTAAKVSEERAKLRNSLIGLSLAQMDPLVSAEVEDANKRFGLDLVSADVQAPVETQFGNYIGETWMGQFEEKATAALELPVEEQREELEKVRSGLSGRSALYAGLLATAVAMVARAVAKSREKRVVWLTLDANACEDCQSEEAKGPRHEDELTRTPGDGSTICLGNCRCILEIEGEE